jgi:hypothetical protein
VPVQGIQPREDLGPFVPICWRRAREPRHTSGVRAAGDKDALAFPVYAMPSPPPLPRGKRAIHGPVLPLNHPMFFGNPEDADLHGGERTVHLPALQPAMRGALGGLLESTGEITPAAAGDQDVQEGLDHLAEGGRRHATTPLHGLRRTQVCRELPRYVA